MGKLTGQTALITGASRGIGRALALALARQGADVALTARSEEALAETARLCRELGVTAGVHALDATDGPAVDALCEALLSEHGSVDVLVNNAGVSLRGHALDGNPDEWARGVALNVSAPMRLTRRLAPAMVGNERGTIINLGSVAAVEGMTEMGVYAATKHAIRGWSLSCYQRLRGAGIKVVLINPGFVDTDMTSGIAGVDSNRMMTVDDVAEAALLAIRTSAACCPAEITLRLTKSAFGET